LELALARITGTHGTQDTSLRRRLPVTSRFRKSHRATSSKQLSIEAPKTRDPQALKLLALDAV